MQKERTIRVIPPTMPMPGLDQPKRACAYVRVSNGHDAQLNSLQNQTKYYERKIKGEGGETEGKIEARKRWLGWISS